GIWHGANWTFLFWGLYFFALLMLEKFVLLKPLENAPAVVGHVYTLALVMVSWAIFAIEDLSHLGGYLKVMFGLGGVPLADGTFGYFLSSYLPILCLAAVSSTPLGRTVYRSMGQKAQYAMCTVLVAGGLLICTAYLVASTYNPFLYFNF
ncbi:MAG: MBOAT family protein, partial [Lawsonibacter sp.]|nr:MBOAT family protein [Lawsonibacter sp.]